MRVKVAVAVPLGEAVTVGVCVDVRVEVGVDVPLGGGVMVGV